MLFRSKYERPAQNDAGNSIGTKMSRRGLRGSHQRFVRIVPDAHLANDDAGVRASCYKYTRARIGPLHLLHGANYICSFSLEQPAFTWLLLSKLSSSLILFWTHQQYVRNSLYSLLKRETVFTVTPASVPADQIVSRPSPNRPFRCSSATR